MGDFSQVEYLRMSYYSWSKSDLFYSSDPSSHSCCGHDGSIDGDIPGKPHMVEMMDHSV